MKAKKKNKIESVTVGNISVGSHHLNDPMVKMLLKANKNKEIKGMDDIAKLIKNSHDDEEWEEVDEWSDEESKKHETPSDTLVEHSSSLYDVDIAARAKDNFLKKKLFSKMNYVCMP
jgi:hypothetical protein